MTGLPNGLHLRQGNVILNLQLTTNRSRSHHNLPKIPTRCLGLRTLMFRHTQLIHGTGLECTDLAYLGLTLVSVALV